LIIHQLEKIGEYVENITVIANEENATVISRLVDNLEEKEKIQVIVQKAGFEGQAGAIASAKNHISGETVVFNGNDIFDYSYLEKMASLPQSKEKVILTGKKQNEYFNGGYFKLDGKKNLVEIIEKPSPDELPSNIVRLVIDYFSDISIIIKEIENVKTKKDDHYEQALNRILAGEVERSYEIYEGYWNTLKYPWHVLDMMKTLLSGIKRNISKTASVSKTALVVGDVFIGENVKVGDFVKIVGPAYIGDNTVVGDYSLVRESQIGEDSLIGSYTEVARSYIGNRVFLHRDYVGDSVMADKSMMGSGAVTANLRFDGKTVTSSFDEGVVDTNRDKLGAIIGARSKIGVNSTLVPGVKIGEDSLIAPGEKVRFDLEDGTYLIRGEERKNQNI
jgi:bifunctional UDP-N-acetylglucosamine pyrophosphorylase/glucosamine-1-phosphate N-acetyltransferase